MENVKIALQFSLLIFKYHECYFRSSLNIPKFLEKGFPRLKSHPPAVMGW